MKYQTFDELKKDYPDGVTTVENMEELDVEYIGHFNCMTLTMRFYGFSLLPFVNLNDDLGYAIMFWMKSFGFDSEDGSHLSDVKNQKVIVFWERQCGRALALSCGNSNKFIVMEEKLDHNGDYPHLEVLNK
jgi:hypothetical protein